LPVVARCLDSSAVAHFLIPPLPFRIFEMNPVFHVALCAAPSHCHRVLSPSAPRTGVRAERVETTCNWGVHALGPGPRK
jgi:hypothetical protein